MSSRLGSWLERRWDAWADEQHSSERLAARFHRGHARLLTTKLALLSGLAAVIAVDVVWTLIERKWHRVADRRHTRAADKEAAMRTPLFIAFALVMLLTAGGYVVEAAEVAPPVAKAATYWLALGGALGGFLRALWVRHQQNMSLETAQDVLMGAVIGYLWTVPLFGVWPPFELPQVHVGQQAAIVGLVAATGVAVVKRVLFRVVPAYMERLAGRLPGGQNSAAAPPPPRA